MFKNLILVISLAFNALVAGIVVFLFGALIGSGGILAIQEWARKPYEKKFGEKQKTESK